MATIFLDEAIRYGSWQCFTGEPKVTLGYTQKVP